MELAQLVKLQEIDHQIMKLKASLGNLPEQVEMLERQLNSTKAEINILKEELDQIDAEKRKLEGEISLLGEKKKKYQEQVYSVTTNKEYDAISAEIETTKAHIEERENTLLDFLDREEKVEQNLEEKEEQINELDSSFKEKDAVLKQKKKANEEELNKLEKERTSIVSQIRKPLYSRYERIRKARGGAALSEIKNYTCQGCFATIPAQTVVEVRKMTDIILCETCGRILISKNSHVNNHSE
ncbi:hypothetical protein GF337_04520 [candidate division KSB1 bacterium]|nr:hypothetical protein [candidate division KSB1 bacterium]